MAKGIGSYIGVKQKEALSHIKHCMYCGEVCTLHIDHIIPPKNGGDSSLENLTKACALCNGIKSDYTMQRFLEMVTRKRDYAYGRAVRSLKRIIRMNRLGLDYSEQEYDRSLFNKYRKEHSRFCVVIGSIKTESYRAFSSQQKNAA